MGCDLNGIELNWIESEDACMHCSRGCAGYVDHSYGLCDT